MRFRFALLSDVHFGPPATFEGRLRKLGDFARPLTEAFVRRMNENVRPDLVANLGDVIEDESPARDERNYRLFLETLAGLDAPVLHVAGNHDSVHLSDEALRDLWHHHEALHYRRDFGPLRFIVLRTEQSALGVTLPETQLAWLEEELDRADRPLIVLLHHPASDMDLSGNRWFEKLPNLARVANRRDLRALLSRSGRVVAVFNGHAHWNHFDLIDGIPYITVQSLIENVDDDAPGRPAAAWAVAEISGRRLRVRVEGLQPVRYQIELG